MPKKPKKDEISGKLKSSYIVEKADPLGLMRSVPFSLGELKILDTYISRINAYDDEPRRTVTFTKNEYVELMGLKTVDPRTLEKYTQAMLSKMVRLEMPDNRGVEQFLLFYAARIYSDEFGQSTVELTCSEQAKDLFFCAGKYHYFQYTLDSIKNLQHEASYLLFIHIMYMTQRTKRGVKEWETEVDELRRLMNCANKESYKEFKIFKRAVLEPAIKEINEKTATKFHIETVKIARTVVRIRFLIDQNGATGKPKKLESKPKRADGNLVGQTSIDGETLGEQDFGSPELNEYAAACGFSFKLEEIKMIKLALDARSDLPTKSKKRADWLQKLYAKLQNEELFKESSGKKISNRIKYFVKMIGDAEPPEEEHETSYDINAYSDMIYGFDPSMLKDEGDD